MAPTKPDQVKTAYGWPLFSPVGWYTSTSGYFCGRGETAEDEGGRRASTKRTGFWHAPPKRGGERTWNGPLVVQSKARSCTKAPSRDWAVALPQAPNMLQPALMISGSSVTPSARSMEIPVAFTMPVNSCINSGGIKSFVKSYVRSMMISSPYL